MTPQEFRARLEEQRRRADDLPRTVYDDHEDYSPGVPVAEKPEGPPRKTA
jgi:hypothetical protein